MGINMKKSNKVAPRSPSQLSASVETSDCAPMKPRRGKNRKRTDAEIEHQGRVAELGCVVCRMLGCYQQGHTELHHFRFGGLRADNHMNVVGLCVEHHKPPRGWHGTRDAFKQLNATPESLLAYVGELLNKGQ